MSAVDWPGLMRVGLGVLRLSPEAFWGMTPREFEAAVSALRGPRAAPMGRAALAALRAAHGDRAEGLGDG